MLVSIDGIEASAVLDDTNYIGNKCRRHVKSRNDILIIDKDIKILMGD